MAIITSLLDTDLYKLTMMQAVWELYPNQYVEYEFTCRNKGIDFELHYPRIVDEIAELPKLRFSEDEIAYLGSYGFFKREFLNFLRTYSMGGICKILLTENKSLSVSLKGKWLDLILYEVPVLAIVNEVYFSRFVDFGEIDFDYASDKLSDKIDLWKEYPQIKISEFGTRRRFSASWQSIVFETLIENMPSQIVGTSNVLLAKKFGKRAHGTQAHEWIMGHLGISNKIESAQKAALYAWLQVYDNDLGTALTDTFTTDAFFRDFGKVLTNAFSGLRHDSGSPFVFGKKALDHYKKMGVDPKNKNLIFSDGLTPQKTVEIWKTFSGEIGLAFGVGTNLTNDMKEVWEPLNIVMKLTKSGNVPCVKLSDNLGKNMGNPEMIKMVKDAYGAY